MHIQIVGQYTTHDWIVKISEIMCVFRLFGNVAEGLGGVEAVSIVEPNLLGIRDETTAVEMPYEVVPSRPVQDPLSVLLLAIQR